MERDPEARPDIPTCAECVELGLRPIPTWLVEMERDVGVGPTLRLLKNHGSRFVTVSEHGQHHGDHAEAKDWLHRHIGWGQIPLPLGPLSQPSRNAWRALRLFRRGASLRAVSLELGCHSRTAARLRRQLTRLGHLAPLERKETTR